MLRQPCDAEWPQSLRVFRRLPVTGARGCTEAGVGKPLTIVVLAESEPAPQLAFCSPLSMACAASSSTIALTIAIVAGSAGNSISSASSDRVTSVGVPNTVVVLRNETVL